MTGIYPFKMGLQRGFGKQTPEGIPLNKTILPEYLKEYGYSTHGLGKVMVILTVIKRSFIIYDNIHIFSGTLVFVLTVTHLSSEGLTHFLVSLLAMMMMMTSLVNILKLFKNISKIVKGNQET